MNLLEIKQYLETNNITLPITIGSLKDSNCIGLFATAGQEPNFFFNKGYIEYKGLQVLVRHQSYAECESIINEIYKLLNNTEGFKPSQSPFTLGRNDKGFMEFSVNYIVMKTEVL